MYILDSSLVDILSLFVYITILYVYTFNAIFYIFYTLAQQEYKAFIAGLEVSAEKVTLHVHVLYLP